MLDLRTAARTIVAARRPVQRSLFMATLFASQAAGCAGFLYWAYAHFHAESVGWAIVSAILVLIPDLQQSVATAIARLCANVVGALTGLLVAHFLGQGPPAIIAAIVAVSYICHILRLDLGLRTACVAVIIVMTAHAGEINISVRERFLAVLVGCATGVTAQLIALAAERRIARLQLPAFSGKTDSSE